MNLKRLQEAGWLLLMFFLGLFFIAVFGVMGYGIYNIIIGIVTEYPLLSGAIIGILAVLYGIAYFLVPYLDISE